MRGLMIVVSMVWLVCSVPVTGLAQDEDDGIRVAEAVITTSVVDRQPTDRLEVVAAGTEQVACWTDLRNAAGQTVIHAWIHDGQTRARVRIEARADRWRCYSTKRLLPGWTGEWEVKILTEDGRVLATVPFTVR